MLRSKACSSVMLSEISGATPLSQICCSVGCIMKKVMNRAKLTITVLGGVPWVPRAVLSKESTITMRTNDVIMTKIEGASVITVKSAISWTMRPVACPPWPKSNVTFCANVGSITAKNAIEKADSAASRRDHFMDLPRLMRGCCALCRQGV